MLLYKKAGIREKGSSALSVVKLLTAKRNFLFCVLPCINIRH